MMNEYQKLHEELKAEVATLKRILKELMEYLKVEYHD